MSGLWRAFRAGETIREVGGQGLGGPRGKGSLSDAKGPKPPIQLLQLLKNSPKEVKRTHFGIYRVPPGPTMSVKLATATATDSASVTDFVQNGHEGAVWPADSKNQVHFDLGSLLQGQNQGQTKGNALAPKLTVRLR